ncbi:MAG TPA: hypothetical protein VFO49_10735, partial [Nocardioides sp.]|nr:hypothetical protein [Nocardioides sp.]
MTDLLELALADPERAWARAEAVVGETSDPLELSIAHQARGIVLRDEGRSTEAVAELRTALRHAVRSGAEREADVRATYGLALVMGGRTNAGRHQLDRAADSATGEALAKILMRRAFALTMLGEQGKALVDMRAALEGTRQSGNRIWEARTLTNLAHVEMALGLLSDAERSCESARRIFDSVGLPEEALDALPILGDLALYRGDLPRAIAIFDEMASAPGRVGYQRADIAASRSEAYLTAGLAAEAVDVLRRLVDGQTLSPWKEADVQLALANARLATGDMAGALAAASEAREAFHSQHRPWFELRARLVQVLSRHELGRRRGLARQASDVARRLDEERAYEAPVALILAGRLATGPERAELWEAAAAYRDRPNALVRASAWLASALVREEADDRGGVLRACGRGLDALDEHRRTLGSSELRALATAHGRELAVLALRHAATDARTLLRWSERWRATALAEPPVTPDGEVSTELAALRDNGRRLAQARAEGEPVEQLETERRRLERAVRAEHHRRTGGGDDADTRLDVDRLVAEVGDRTLVEL